MATIHHPIVGTVRFQATGNGGLRLLDNWAAANIGTVFIPELKGIPTYSGTFSGNVSFYKPAIPQLKAAWAEVGRAGLRNKVLFWSGSFVPRMKRGSTTSPSNHSFGTAFDINHQQNPFRRKPAAVGAHGDVHAIADVFRRFGFEWGGDWRNTPDGMHFEVNKIIGNAVLTTVVPATPTKPTEPPMLVLNGSLAGPVLLQDGKLWVQARAVLEASGHTLTGVNDSIAEKNRFYINVERKV